MMKYINIVKYNTKRVGKMQGVKNCTGEVI